MGRYEAVLRETAELACDRCAEYAGQRLKSLRGGRGAFYANVYPDEFRFAIGVVDEYEYLVYQDTGFETFVMTALKGKTVPLMIDGQRVFRKVTNVGQFNTRRPGMTTYWRRDINGKLFGSVERRRSWVHPGLPPKNFIADGATAAAREKAQDLYEALIFDMGIR